MSEDISFGDTVNLFYPLSEAVSYPESDFIDMVLRVIAKPDQGLRELRLWLKSDASNPEIEINSKRFTAIGRSPDGNWLDFGRMTEETDEFGLPGFGIIRFFGLPVEQAGESHCVITSQTDLELSGSLEDAEKVLQGISRSEAGYSTLSPSRAKVGSSNKFTMRYTAGSQGLKSGAFIRIVLPNTFSTPQTSDREAEGWLAPLEKDAVKLISLDKSIESHEGVDAIYQLEKDLEPSGTLSFEYQSAFVYIFPETWERMERRYWWSHLPVMAPSVAVDERKIFVPPFEHNGHSLKIEPGPVERLFLFLPGRLNSDKQISLTGLFTDRYRNIPAYSPIPTNFELILEGKEKRSLGSAKKRFTNWYRFEMTLSDLKPGVYRVSAVDKTDGKIIARSNPLRIIESESNVPQIYWGEIHAHSERSDGSGGYNNMFTHAKECGNLDFAAAADHACYHTDNEWLWMQDVVNFHNQDHCFATLLGYEWAGKQGHRNLYTSKNSHDLFRGMTPGQTTLDVVYDHFNDDENVVAGPHTCHTMDFYDCHNSNVQRYMEIYSMWGNYEELGFDILNKGAKIGFTGGGDCHEGRCGFSVEDAEGQGITPHTFSPGLKYRCGLTAALLKNLTRKELVRALRDRNIYATSGARILLDFEISKLKMGEVGFLDEFPEIKVDINACGAIKTIDVVKNGEIAYSIKNAAEDYAFTWRDDSGEKGWYLIRVTQEDGHKAWSSPIWVEVMDS